MRTLQILDNLIQVHRYSGNLLVKSESVSDHVWCMNSLAFEYIPRMNKMFELDISLKDVIYGIALHDLDEALYCDIPRKFKHHNESIEKAIHDTVKCIMDETLSKDLIKDINRYEDKSTFYGCLIKILDIAQAGYKMISEIQLGNRYFINELPNACDCLVGILELIDKASFTPSEKVGLNWLCDEFLKEFNLELSYIE